MACEQLNLLKCPLAVTLRKVGGTGKRVEIRLITFKDLGFTRQTWVIHCEVVGEGWEERGRRIVRGTQSDKGLEGIEFLRLHHYFSLLGHSNRNIGLELPSPLNRPGSVKQRNLSWEVA